MDRKKDVDLVLKDLGFEFGVGPLAFSVKSGLESPSLTAPRKKLALPTTLSPFGLADSVHHQGDDPASASHAYLPASFRRQDYAPGARDLVRVTAWSPKEFAPRCGNRLKLEDPVGRVHRSFFGFASQARKAIASPVTAAAEPFLRLLKQLSDAPLPLSPLAPVLEKALDPTEE